jgi:drug/metabolite transporter (DMT)-like permease
VIFARILLGEKLNLTGALIIGVSLTGASVMLWHPEMGMPWPKSVSEWLGLMAGVFFSLSNVLIKKTSDLSIELKSLAVFVGVMFWSLLIWPFFPHTSWNLEPSSWGMLVVIGITLVFTNAIVQYAISHTRAAQAIVVMLFELVIAAIASWLLADETLGVREWIGGALIVSASLLSIKLGNGH